MVDPLSKMSSWYRLGLVLLVVFALPWQCLAGNIDAPAAPGESGSAMHTLQDLYDQAASGTVIPKRTGAFVEPGSGPGSSMRSIDEIQGALPVPDNTNGAAPAEVKSGKKYWGLRTDGSWGHQTGTSSPQTLNSNSTTVNAGYYESTTLEAVEPDLSAENIKKGATLFGIAGSSVEGNRKRGCSTFLIPYMPYAANASQIIYITSLPVAWVGAGSANNKDVQVTAVSDTGYIYDLGTVASLPGNTVLKLTSFIKTALEVQGFTGGKVALEIRVPNPENVVVYASYNAGTVRKFVPVECIR